MYKSRESQHISVLGCSRVELWRLPVNAGVSRRVSGGSTVDRCLSTLLLRFIFIKYGIHATFSYGLDTIFVRDRHHLRKTASHVERRATDADADHHWRGSPARFLELGSRVCAILIRPVISSGANHVRGLIIPDYHRFPLACLCSKRSSSLVHVSMELSPPGERRWKCDQCESTFARPDHLRRHSLIRMHYSGSHTP